MRAMVHSIPGSGTRFTTRLLLQVLGYEQLAPQYIRGEPVKSKKFTQWHVSQGSTPGHAKIYDAVKGGLKVIVPVRSPVATALTREKNLCAKTIHETKQLWATLRETIDGYDHVLLPVEAPWFDHHRLLGIVARHLKVEPNVELLKDTVEEWPRVGSRGDRPERVEYNSTGRTTIQGQDSSVLDAETAWYIELLAKFAATTYAR